MDSYAAPEPSPEPGYTDEVIMASGSFTQGSTIELSCDGPLREPYTCYLQGGLNFAASVPVSCWPFRMLISRIDLFRKKA